MKTRCFNRGIVLGAAILLCGRVGTAWADDTADLKKELEQMREQNHLMEQRLEKQQEMIDQLNHKFEAMLRPPRNGSAGVGAETSTMDVSAKATTDLKNEETGSGNGSGFSVGNMKISGEGGVGFVETERNGYYPNAQFLVDEARLFLDAPLWKNVYFYGELNLRTQESENDGLDLGELYLEFEDLTPWKKEEDLLNVRLGQFYIPFGEEYQARYAIDDPLISHSLSDIWGLSAGLELFGSINKFSYAVAAQSGGISLVEENEADKSIAGRFGYDPTSWLHFSASAMRTGDINATEDHVSALWFGGGLFQSIGSTQTSLFHDGLAELDGEVKWHGGSFKAAGGYADYNDNDPARSNYRNLYYYYGELVQGVTEKLYGAVRWSQIRAGKGYPVLGDNDNDFSVPTTDLWRLSVGAGYRFNQHLLLKAEYLIEQGRLADGSLRNHENMFVVEGAFKF
jgi:hypothetical protein